MDLDLKLVNEAMKLSGQKSRCEVVNYALEELVRKLKRKKILELEGKLIWTGNLDETMKNRQ